MNIKELKGTNLNRKELYLAYLAIGEPEEVSLLPEPMTYDESVLFKACNDKAAKAETEAKEAVHTDATGRVATGEPTVNPEETGAK